ncbi:MAG: GNAT family N-acetyltransferase [Halobacteriaceae archaeon]
MYVRGAKKREEVWLLDRLEELGIDDPAFRSRDYVVALDEETGEKAGFGRLRVHTAEDDSEVCELTAIGTLAEWREQGVGAHVVERLVEMARDKGFDELYACTQNGGYLTQFGFEPIPESELPEPLGERLAAVRERDPEAVPLRLDTDAFTMPPRHRERFKAADTGEETEEVQETPEDFGIDPDEATYKYDTGG